MKIKRGEYLYPKGSAFFERFNRSLQEDFVDYREEELRDDLEGFNRELMGYLIWYNTERIHVGLGGKAPLQYFCEKFLKNPAESKKIWTHTILFSYHNF